MYMCVFEGDFGPGRAARAPLRLDGRAATWRRECMCIYMYIYIYICNNNNLKKKYSVL